MEVKFLRDYIDAGGFLLGVETCEGGDFRAGFEELVAKMYPEDSPRLERLGAEHPVFRSEYLLNADVVELYGADLGCRTPIMFSPVDLSCYWDLWTPYDLPGPRSAVAHPDYPEGEHGGEYPRLRHRAGAAG